MTLGQFVSRAEWTHRQRYGYDCVDPHGALQLVTLYKWMSRRMRRPGGGGIGG